MTPIASFDDSAPAEKLARMLCEEGFGAITDNDAAEQLLRFCNPHPHGQWHVLVPPDKLDAALARLHAMDAAASGLQFAIKCPSCNSTQVEFPQFSRNTIVGAFIPAAAAALGLAERQFYCTSCHFTWAPGDEGRAPTQLPD